MDIQGMGGKFNDPQRGIVRYASFKRAKEAVRAKF
jgi:hypothetical protein